MVCHIKIGGNPTSFTFRELGSITQVSNRCFSFYAKNNWSFEVNMEEVVSKVAGYANLSAPTTAEHDIMSVLTKIIYKVVINNIVPMKEGRIKTTIQYYLLIDQLIRKNKVSLPKMILLHLKHAREMHSHGNPYGGLIKMILKYLGSTKREPANCPSENL